ncbi:substrate-binding domain-containing protein [Streptomyces sp. S07_1.15]|uniref:sugar ABC transporter substrate-binding protein n=1 Tax=Streptomyces sp. S07_1.15 TaxID=2873925 RepID=UPI001D13FCBA|nr:substrate-binding domain-containing protein [Streptomyces sp. S07_1.15]MCC3650566.1 substrate-binding domain-containing protein [Streptomyces sp. S07_1.15]
MKPRRGRAVAALGAAALVLVIAACGQAAQAGRQPDGASATPRTGGFTIGLLLPANQADRWERFDRPLIESRVRELCPTCTVRYSPSGPDAAAQQRQLRALLTSGIDVLILGSVDSRAARPTVRGAAAAGVPVVAYDQLAKGPLSGYVSYNGEEIGRLQATALLRALGPNASRPRIVMLNGSPTDPNAADLKKGALSVLKGRVEIAKRYEVLNWDPLNAYADMTAAIADLGPDRIDGVYAANDGLASGAIAALRSASVRPLPPITGQDADLAAVQRIVTGEQYMTVYKPFTPEARAAAEMAVALGRGESVEDIATGTVDNGSRRDIPSVVLEPIALTAETIDTVIRSGKYTTDQICTPDIRSACEEAGLLG